ncbi:MAG TPA: Asp-tRNA(Asn)/Glu-tRNA(Gln) amidotransferase subunit GatC [Candidatus Saccharimonadales bacterium]|nr:Asp-tRNA(Asn)/Glu-tRNA(Gln) amidotransferase subunit GatC [Candidatus Saccharimonadales bacterium]
MSGIDKKTVEKIAQLANLKLSESEVTKFTSQLSEVIDYNVEQLNKVDTEKVEPLLNASGLVNSTREDITEPSLSQDQVLKNAKETHNGFFKVKQILDQT